MLAKASSGNDADDIEENFRNIARGDHSNLNMKLNYESA